MMYNKQMELQKHRRKIERVITKHVKNEVLKSVQDMDTDMTSIIQQYKHRNNLDVCTYFDCYEGYAVVEVFNGRHTFKESNLLTRLRHIEEYPGTFTSEVGSTIIMYIDLRDILNVKSFCGVGYTTLNDANLYSKLYEHDKAISEWVFNKYSSKIFQTYKQTGGI